MPRMYTVIFENVTVSAAQDLFSLKGSTGKTIRCKRVVLGATNTTLQTAQSLRLRVKYLPATVTAGSGGTAPTPQLLDPGDAAAAFTARVNDTTQATTSGTAATLVATGVHNFAGWDFPMPDAPYAGLNEQITIDLPSTVAGTCAFSGTAYVEETGS